MAELGWDRVLTHSPDSFPSQLGLLLLESSINSRLEVQSSGCGQGPADKGPPFCTAYNVKTETPNAVTFAHNQVTVTLITRTETFLD